MNRIRPDILTIIKLIFTISALCFLMACSTQDEERYTSEDSRLEFPYYPGSDNKQDRRTQRLFPWELWSPSKDMDGLPLINFKIIKGDEIARSGDREGALREYLTVEARGLLPQEQEALIFRIASMQLSLNRIKDSLHTVSRFFTERNETEENVSAQFSILLGYAYARSSEIDQSMAWFSRAHKLSSYNKSYSAIAESGVRGALRKLTADELNRLTAVWSEDTFIRTLVGQEKEILARSGTTRDATTDVIPSDLGDQSNSTQTSLNPTVSNVPIGVVLPLSGRYAALGRNTKNGIELALSDPTTGASTEVNLLLRDSGGDAFAAASHAREMLASLKPVFFLVLC